MDARLRLLFRCVLVWVWLHELWHVFLRWLWRASCCIMCTDRPFVCMYLSDLSSLSVGPSHLCAYPSLSSSSCPVAPRLACPTSCLAVSLCSYLLFGDSSIMYSTAASALFLGFGQSHCIRKLGDIHIFIITLVSSNASLQIKADLVVCRVHLLCNYVPCVIKLPCISQAKLKHCSLATCSHLGPVHGNLVALHASQPPASPQN